MQASSLSTRRDEARFDVDKVFKKDVWRHDADGDYTDDDDTHRDTHRDRNRDRGATVIGGTRDDGIDDEETRDAQEKIREIQLKMSMSMGTHGQGQCSPQSHSASMNNTSSAMSGMMSSSTIKRKTRVRKHRDRSKRFCKLYAIDFCTPLRRVDTFTSVCKDGILKLIKTASDLRKLEQYIYQLVDSNRCSFVSVWLEEHKQRSYLGRTTSMCLSLPNDLGDFIVDTLELQHDMYILRNMFASPTLTKIFFNAQHTTELLQRDFNIFPRCVFCAHTALFESISCAATHGYVEDSLRLHLLKHLPQHAPTFSSLDISCIPSNHPAGCSPRCSSGPGQVGTMQVSSGGGQLGQSGFAAMSAVLDNGMGGGQNTEITHALDKQQREEDMLAVWISSCVKALYCEKLGFFGSGVTSFLGEDMTCSCLCTEFERVLSHKIDTSIRPLTDVASHIARFRARILIPLVQMTLFISARTETLGYEKPVSLDAMTHEDFWANLLESDGRDDSDSFPTGSIGSCIVDDMKETPTMLPSLSEGMYIDRVTEQHGTLHNDDEHTPISIPNSLLMTNSHLYITKRMIRKIEDKTFHSAQHVTQPLLRSPETDIESVKLYVQNTHGSFMKS
ncbi:Exosome complex exonuclease Rrp6-like protein, partial [Aduncisulcus paluster]